MSDIMNELKLLLIYNQITMQQLLNGLNTTYGRNEALSNFHRKLTNETIKYKEILEIAEVLDYNIAWIPKEMKLEAGRNGLFYSGASRAKDRKPGIPEGVKYKLSPEGEYTTLTNSDDSESEEYVKSLVDRYDGSIDPKMKEFFLELHKRNKNK